MEASAAAPALSTESNARAKHGPFRKSESTAVIEADCKWAGDDTAPRLRLPEATRLVPRREGPRVAADTCDGEVAEKKARETDGGFEAAAKGEPTPVPAGALTTLLEDAVKTFLTSKRQSDVTEKHVAKLKFELGAFSAFALGKGLVNLGDIKTEHVLAYRNSLVGAQNTRAKKIFRLIGFFKFCLEMGWIQRNVAQVSAVKLKYDDSQTPKALTDAQFETLMAAIPKVNGRTTDEQRRKLRGSSCSCAGRDWPSGTP